MGGFCNPRGFPAIAATAAVAALLLSGLAAPADTQPAPELTAAQKERLKERDRIGKQVEAMRAQKKLPEAIKAAEAKLAIEREVLGETGDAAIESLELLAQLHQDVEDWAAATRARTEVLALRTRTQSKDQRQSKEARWALERVETLAKLDRAGRSRLAEADRLDRQVYELFARGENRKAEGLARQAVQIRQELQGEHHPDYALSLSNLASQLMHMGQPAAARQLLERVAALTRETLGEDHDRYAYCLLNLAGCCLIQGDYVPARPMLEKALALIKQSHGERHPVFILCLNNLGDCLCSRAIMPPPGPSSSES